MASEQTGSTASATTLSPVKIWGPPGVIAVLIFVLSSTPRANFPEHPEFANDIVHFLEFGILAFFLARALNYGYSMNRTGILLLSITLCAAFGLLDEAHQFLVPERIFDLKDLLYDLAGAALGSLCYAALISLRSGGAGESPARAGKMDD